MSTPPLFFYLALGLFERFFPNQPRKHQKKKVKHELEAFFCFKSCEKSLRSLKDALDGDGTEAGMRLEEGWSLGWRMAGGGRGRRDIVKALPWCPVHAQTCRLTNHTLTIPVTNLHSQSPTWMAQQYSPGAMVS